MKIIRSIKALNQIITDNRARGFLIGFVPTMGSIHRGHISLVQKSMLENNYTICSIYVNPTQFNDKTDFIKYPREEEKDIKILHECNCDAVFLPNDKEMYPKKDETFKDDFISEYMNILEGEKRPGHFLGVITIVNKLFNLIQPDKAYFGEKDYQQLYLIRFFVKKFKIPVEIRACKIVRGKDGLALSSRNKHLTLSEKRAARYLFTALKFLQKKLADHKRKNTLFFLDEKAVNDLKKLAINNIINNSLIKLDYFEIIEVENFRFAKTIDNNKIYRILIAAYIGNTRLIDNILIG